MVLYKKLFYVGFVALNEMLNSTNLIELVTKLAATNHDALF